MLMVSCEQNYGIATHGAADVATAPSTTPAGQDPSKPPSEPKGPVLSCSGPQHSPTYQGAGTAESPYLVSNPCQLNAIRDRIDLMDKHFKLINDIDVEPLVKSSLPLEKIGSLNRPFCGTLNGDGFKVHNSAAPAAGSCIGLVQVMGVGGTTLGAVKSDLSPPAIGAGGIGAIIIGSTEGCNGTGLISSGSTIGTIDVTGNFSGCLVKAYSGIGRVTVSKAIAGTLFVTYSETAPAIDLNATSCGARIHNLRVRPNLAYCSP